MATVMLMAGYLQGGENVEPRYVIIHADDAGMSHSVNSATIEAMQRGLVSSASIMVPCPWFPEFAEYARQHPEKDFGVHLTLNAEWARYRWGPVAGRERVPSLVDKEGHLWSDVFQVAANAKPNEVELELRAQIERAKQFGVPLSHLDTHMGALLMRPDLLEIYVNLGIEHDLPILFMRDVQSDEIKRRYPVVARKGAELIDVLTGRQLPVLDDIFQHYEDGPHEKRKAAYLEAIRNLSPGVTQIIVHCGIDNAELQAITSSSKLRDSDRRVFTDADVIAEIESLPVEIITWKKFRTLVAGQSADTTTAADP